MIVPWTNGNAANVALCTAVGDQSNCQITTDGSGGAIVVWEDKRDGTNTKAYAQRVSNTGKPLWITDGVLLSTAAGWSYLPQLVEDGAGGAIVVWQGSPIPGEYRIAAQRIDASGNILWATDGVIISAGPNPKQGPHVATDGIGGAIIAWMDERNGVDYDIYANRIDGSGIVRWAVDGIPICDAIKDQSSCQITSDGQGGGIIAWEDWRAGNPEGDIYAQRVDGTGTTLWTLNGVSVCQAVGIQQNVQLVSDGTGGAFFTWEDYRWGTFWAIYAQRISNSGLAWWASDGIELSLLNENSASCRIATDGQGGAIIVWQDQGPGLSPGVYAQRVSDSGLMQWPEGGLPICNILHAGGISPQIVSDGQGGAIITWEDTRADFLSPDIYSQHVDRGGAVLWAYQGVPVSTAQWDQTNPVIVADGNGGAVIAWTDGRLGLIEGFDIYAQGITSTGQD
jgi:hypothetical protein